MAAMLGAAGYRVHRFASPHLVRVEESIALAGLEIAADPLAAALERCEATGCSATAFEALTAAAFLTMSETPADFALVEAGLGGALDATNAIPPPRLAVLTPVDIDHAEFLGDGVAAIAAQKAGIVKPSSATVSGPQPTDAMAAIRARCEAVGAPLHAYEETWTAVPTEDGFSYAGPRWTFLELPHPAMPGTHQAMNAALAVAALEMLEEAAVGEDAIRMGLALARLPARLERIETGPLTARLPAGWSLWLDGGHNAAAGRALAEWAGREAHGPLILVAGMLASKDARGFLAPLAPLADRLFAVPVAADRPGMNPESLAAAARSLGLEAETAADPGAALDVAARAAPGPATVLICGSLYLAGAILDQARDAGGDEGL